jgi:hypothetical protein
MEPATSDAEVMSEALKQHVASLRYAGQSLRGDRAFMLEAATQHAGALAYAA